MVPVDELERMGAQEIVAVDLGSHAEKPQKVDNVIGVLSRCFALACRRKSRTSPNTRLSSCSQMFWDVGFPTPAKARLDESGKACAEKNMPRLADDADVVLENP